MSKKVKRSMVLLLTFVLMFSSLPSAFAAGVVNKLVYEVEYSAEDLSTPMDWYNSDYFNNPAYKENRFVQYWVQTPLATGGPRDTGFYMVYNEEGLSIFFQSNEPDRDTEGVLKNSSIEFFLQTGLDNIPYHQMIIQTNGSPNEYYEWQTENRNNRPLKGNAIVINEELPTGWGTVVNIPWEVYYDYVPLDGEDWEFSMIRWSPDGNFSPTWGGNVHQVGKFNVLDFQTPTAEQRTAIQKSLITKAWQKFNDTAAGLSARWQNGNASDVSFFNRHIQPLIAEGQARGSAIPNLNSLSAAEIDELYQHVNSWFELRYDAEDGRVAYVKDSFFMEDEPGIEVPNALTLSGSESVIAGQSFDVIVGVENLRSEFMTLDVIVNYDPEKLEFELVGAAGSESLGESVVEMLKPNFSLLGSAVKPELGKIRLIMSSSGEQYAVAADGPLFKLNGKVKSGTAVGGTTVALSTAEVSLDGISKALDTSLASFELNVVVADKAALAAAIADAQSLHDAAVEGTQPGQYPVGSKAVLAAAIQDAIAVHDSAAATQAQINQAAIALNAAVAAFEASVIPTPPGDRTALNAAIAVAESMHNKAQEGDKLGKYTVGSKAVLNAAIESARTAGPSQAAVDLATAALQTAMQQFQAQFITLVPGETKVTIKDLSIIAKYYGITSEDEGWSEIEKADVLGLNVIDVRNLAAVAQMILDEWRLE